MVNTTSHDGEQNPPRGSDTVVASSMNTSTTIPHTHAIPTSIGSVAINNSTTMPLSSSAAGIPSNAQIGSVFTHVGNQAQCPTPRPPGFETFRPLREPPPYGMPTSFMAGLHNSTTITQSLVQGYGSRMNNMGRNTQNQGSFTQMPILTTSNQAAFRQQMDDSNHDMVGVLAREMSTIFTPLIQNINRTNQENTHTYQQMSVQVAR